ncbi:MAG: efflux RND transporter permease subunit [Candidatus Moranbacteria bacterium]|nr:efflux RND transporter permease subunit [Candidatus Moranbacteria bacterium]
MVNEKNTVGISGKITRLFLNNRELSILSILIIAAWGIVSFVLMPKQYNPEIVAPAFIISTDLPDADSREVFELVTRRLEDVIKEIPEVDEISSQSFSGGKSMVMVKFYVGSDLEKAKITLSQKLRDNAHLKPAGASEPIIQTMDPEDVPIISIGLTSDKFSEEALRKAAIDIADNLKQVEGTSKIEIKGGHTNNLNVSLDAGKLAALNVSPAEAAQAIRSANGTYGVHTFKNDSYNPVLTVDGNIRDAQELENIIIRSQAASTIRLSDVATIDYGPGEITEYVRLREKETAGTSTPVVYVAISKLKGANATTVANAVIAKLDAAKDTFIPREIEARIFHDEGATADEEITKLSVELAKSIAIVGAVLLLILGFRSALIVSLVIPLILFAVFAVGNLFGETINRITLFALILSLGLLVDDAIVVVENINRYFRMKLGIGKTETVVRAVDEVGSALFMSTLTMILAFVPMAFVTGMMGPYIGPIPFFVPVALAASLLFAVTLNPFFAHLFNKETAQEKKAGIIDRTIGKIETVYARTIRFLLDYPRARNMFLAGTALAIIVSLSLPMLKIVKFRMLPKADKEQFYLYLDLPGGTNIGKTDLLAMELEKNILAQENIESVESFVGQSQIVDFNGLFKGSSFRVQENQATLKINLTHPESRDAASEEIASGVREISLEFSQAHPDANIKIVEDPPGPPVLATLFLKVQGDDTEKITAIARDVKKTVSEIDGVVDLDTSIPEQNADQAYRVNIEKCQRLGIAPDSVNQTLLLGLRGMPVGSYRRQDETLGRRSEQEQIIVRLAGKDREFAENLNRLSIPAQDGTPIPISELINRVDSDVDSMIYTDERQKTVSISAEMENRSVVYAVFDIFPKLLDYKLPGATETKTSWTPFGVTYTDTETGEQYSVMIDGEWKLTLEVFRDLGIVMALVMFLIYFVVAAQTESLVIPLLIMGSIPLSLIGVLPGFAVLGFVKDTYFNATSMIGVIALSGLAVKNAIIYLEYLEPLRRQGLPLKDALVETGRIRLLPIILTSLTAILGSLTIVSDPVWEGLAWAIVFGLTASTLLTLLVFPILYYLFERKAE